MNTETALVTTTPKTFTAEDLKPTAKEEQAIKELRSLGRALWRKAAKKQGWPVVCVDLIDGLAANSAIGGKQGVLDVLNAHSVSTAQPQSQFTPQQIADESERLAGTFGETEGA